MPPQPQPTGRTLAAPHLVGSPLLRLPVPRAYRQSRCESTQGGLTPAQKQGGTIVHLGGQGSPAPASCPSCQAPTCMRIWAFGCLLWGWAALGKFFPTLASVSPDVK